MKQGKSGAKASGKSAKIFARNRRARFDYHIVEVVECGLILAGWEVKSIRAGKASLIGAYVHFRANEAWLLGMQTVPLESTDLSSVTGGADRTRKLLMKKAQVRKLVREVRSGNFSCVPLELYQGRSSYLKISIGLGQGRKKADKRERIKEREWQRSKDKTLNRAVKAGPSG
ncbi:MAG: SsrA-binding protein SmpB [Gammaproteobacteria bacterium]|nr:SsrA-binding protein SmpB [Pseudomonadota bacterium]MCH9662234.1 SsrA-binding protein SmpB [Gammaproteobacteria bacterium]